MRIIIIIAGLACLAFILFRCATSKTVNTVAKWDSVATLEDAEIFVDTANIKREGNIVIATEKKVFITQSAKDKYVSKIKALYIKMGHPKKADKWNDFSYSITTSEYDCPNSKFRVLSVENYDSQGNRIIKTTSNKETTEWLTVDRETVGDYTFFFVCDYGN